MSCILVVKALEWNCMHCFDFKGSLTSPRPERSLPEGSPWSRPIKPRYRCFLGGNLYLFDHLAFGESHWKTFNLLQWCSQADIWFRISTLCERPSAKVWVIVPLKPTQGWCWASGKNITLMYLCYLLCTVHQWGSGAWRSGYTLNLCPHFFLNGPAKDERPVSYTVTCKFSLAYLVHSKMGTPKVIFAHCHLTSAA